MQLMDLRRQLLVLLLFVAIAQASVMAPVSAQAGFCQVQINDVKFPSQVNPAQSVQVKTEITATFATSGENYATGRADLKDRQSGQVLSIQTFDLGYSGGLPVTVQQEVTHTVTAPSSTGTWSLEVIIYCTITGTFPVVTSDSFDIQIGSQVPQDNLAKVQVLRNGDFENDLSNWQTIGFPGYSSASKLAHSGSGGLELLVYTRPDIGPLVTTRQGVSQTVQLTNVRGLRAEAWFLMKITGPSDARLRVTVGGLTLNYYIAFYNPLLAQSRDNTTSKSILLNQYAPYGLWSSMNQDVAQDFQSSFGLAGQKPFQEPKVTIQVSLELVTYGTLQGPQYLYWDDVKATASILPLASTTSITNSSVTTSYSSTPTATPISGTITSPTSPAMSQAFTQSAAQTYFSIEQLLPASLVVIVIFAGAILIILLKRTRPGKIAPSTQVCPKCGFKSTQRNPYCCECGTKLP
jgi:hypothetical protein